MNIDLQDSIIKDMIAKKDALDNQPASIVGMSPNFHGYIVLTVAEGSPCARELERNYRRILGRNDFHVRRHPSEDYRRGNSTHDYLVVGKDDTAARILSSYYPPRQK